MTRSPSNTDDVIDSRDIIARIEELSEERDAHNATADDTVSITPWTEEFPEDAAELAALEALAKDAEGYAPDWRHGETLIRDSYFTDYVTEMLEDCGDIPKGLPWYVVIDWDATAEHIRQDYTSVEYGDVTYWIR